MIRTLEWVYAGISYVTFGMVFLGGLLVVVTITLAVVKPENKGLLRKLMITHGSILVLFLLFLGTVQLVDSRVLISRGDLSIPFNWEIELATFYLTIPSVIAHIGALTVAEIRRRL